MNFLILDIGVVCTTYAWPHSRVDAMQISNEGKGQKGEQS
jgi:hypothetical protein